MAWQKQSKKDLEDRLIKIKRIKSCLETGQKPYGNRVSMGIISEWESFIKLTHPEQMKIWADWEKYYQDVKETPSYALFQEQRAAEAKKDWARVKDLAEQAKEMRKNGDHITLKKPSTVDPWEYNYGVVKFYKDCEKAIEEMNRELNMPELEEASNIFNS